MSSGTGIAVRSGQGVFFRRLEAAAILIGSFALAAFVVYHRGQVQDDLWSLGWLAYPLALLLMTVVASAPFSVTDALAIMNGAIFGPLAGSLINAGGLVIAAVIAYFIALRTNKLLDIEQQLDRLPRWIKRWPVASPMFLILARLLPVIGGTVATQTAAAYRVSLWTQIWTKCIVAVPIATVLAVFGDSAADYVHRIAQPVKTYVIEHSKREHTPPASPPHSGTRP
ncbi:MAG: TVP38/TMEM64 family protein [Candidatus Eremiobacteraeota bacterium]|nr:TVP38/TMEM64 family protein [Candidatus Eremiobacteraeota bacterium]